MANLIDTLQDCLDFFKLPDIQYEEQTGFFVRSSINKTLMELKNSGQISHTAKMEIKALDSKFWTCNEADWKKIIKWDWTDEKRYVAEQYDCDNFAFNFKARVARKFGVNSVGLVIDYSGKHAYNLIVFSDGTWKIFEPQSDKWPKLGSRNYKFEDGFILI
tara:strand:+ start:179 stop:661 length:483 start_codon:yes stop_codon:yes gene_type:complete